MVQDRSIRSMREITRSNPRTAVVARHDPRRAHRSWRMFPASSGFAWPHQARCGPRYHPTRLLSSSGGLLRPPASFLPRIFCADRPPAPSFNHREPDADVGGRQQGCAAPVPSIPQPTELDGFTATFWRCVDEVYAPLLRKYEVGAPRGNPNAIDARACRNAIHCMRG